MVTSLKTKKKKQRRKQLHAEHSELRSEHGLGPEARRTHSNPFLKHLGNWDQELALGQNQSAKLYTEFKPPVDGGRDEDMWSRCIMSSWG